MLLVFGALALVVLAILGIMLWGAFANLSRVCVGVWHVFKDLITS